MTIIFLVQHNNKISPYFLFELETFNSSLNNDIASWGRMCCGLVLACHDSYCSGWNHNLRNKKQKVLIPSGRIFIPIFSFSRQIFNCWWLHHLSAVFIFLGDFMLYCKLSLLPHFLMRWLESKKNHSFRLDSVQDWAGFIPLNLRI